MVLATTGPRRVGPTARTNISKSERQVSALLGGVLVASGMKRRGLGGLALTLFGAELVRRGATGHCMLYDAIGFSSDTHEDYGGHRAGLPGSRTDVRGAAATVNARKAIKIERTITIQRPAQELYDFWRDFQNLPRFLDHIESVWDLGGGRSHWIAKAGSRVRVEWDAEIVNDIPGELIAWKTVGNPDVAHAGSVHFTPSANGRSTNVRMVMDYEPMGGRIAAVAARFVGESPDQKIHDDLERLKLVIETGAVSTTRGESTGHA